MLVPLQRRASPASVARLQCHAVERRDAQHLDVVRPGRRPGDADRLAVAAALGAGVGVAGRRLGAVAGVQVDVAAAAVGQDVEPLRAFRHIDREESFVASIAGQAAARPPRSEEKTSELQSLMRLPYAVFCFTKKTTSISYTTKL